MKRFEKKEFRRLLLALFVSVRTCTRSSLTKRDSALRNICYFVVSCNLARQALVQSTMLTTCEVIEGVVYIIDSLYKYRTEIISTTKSDKGNTDRPPCLNNLRILISCLFLHLLIYLFDQNYRNTRKHSSRMCTAHLPTVFVLVAATKCRYWLGVDPPPHLQVSCPGGVGTHPSGHTHPLPPTYLPLFWNTIPPHGIPTLWTEWQTSVKALPSRNFVGRQ